MLKPLSSSGFSLSITWTVPCAQRSRWVIMVRTSSGAKPRASTSWWYADFQPWACRRIQVAMSSVTEIVAIGRTGCASSSRPTSTARTMAPIDSMAPSGDHSRLASEVSAASSKMTAAEVCSGSSSNAVITSRSARIAVTSASTTDRAAASTRCWNSKVISANSRLPCSCLRAVAVASRTDCSAACAAGCSESACADAVLSIFPAAYKVRLMPSSTART